MMNHPATAERPAAEWAEEPRLCLGILVRLRRGRTAAQAARGGLSTYMISPKFAQAVTTRVRQRGGEALLFTPADVDWDARSVRGCTWNPATGGWHVRSFPLPGLVYDRYFGRTQESSTAMRAFRHRLQRVQGVRVVNGGYFDKGNVYRILGQDPETARLLPRTVALRESRDLRRMLANHPTVYAKPRANCGGRGIIRIQRRGPGWWCQYWQNKQWASLQGGLDRVVQHVWTLTGGEPYIVQQGIALPRWQGRHFDFRVMVQKDGHGRWCVGGVGAKVAGPDSITTHVRRGGTVAPPLPVLTAVFGERAAGLLDQVTQAGLAGAHALGRALQRPFGDLGVDVALDTAGRPWILEINAKSGTTVFKVLPGFERWIDRLVDYAFWLAGRPA